MITLPLQSAADLYVPARQSWQPLVECSPHDRHEEIVPHEAGHHGAQPQPPGLRQMLNTTEVGETMQYQSMSTTVASP